MVTRRWRYSLLILALALVGAFTFVKWQQLQLEEAAKLPTLDVIEEKYGESVQIFTSWPASLGQSIWPESEQFDGTHLAVFLVRRFPYTFLVVKFDPEDPERKVIRSVIEAA